MARMPSLAGVSHDPAGVTITTDRGMADDFRERVMTWLLANDINPAMMPEDNTIRIEDDVIAYTGHRKSPDGRWILSAEGAYARFVMTTPVVEPVPDAPWPMSGDAGTAGD